ncbi:hypothetical protein [Mesonia aquimarina]|uniref:hypothetical protein n=1 Tax=Mesonia aquimarina TaxID=1504967 RepID=UPI001968B9C3|nr:hypothetical protein [Mesonia aquimarina]
MKVFKFFEYAYLVVAVFFAFEAYRIWEESQGRAYIFIGFVAVAIFMFFFKRRFRKKMEQNNQD